MTLKTAIAQNIPAILVRGIFGASDSPVTLRFPPQRLQ